MDDGDAGRSDWFPSGIVLLPVRSGPAVPQQRRPSEPKHERPGSGASCTWSVVDAGGAPLGTWPTHRQVMADLGRLALRGARLPLVVHGPDGQPTGDRLG